VASRVGGNLEAVVHGQTGLLFDSGDAADLARQLEVLIRDPDLRARMASAGVEVVRTRFSHAAAIRCMQQAYLEALR
jgi:glycosyltransferase involved in cell wall biosynthesis